MRDNADSYLEQLRPILDFETPGRLEIRYNSEWLNQLDLAQIQNLLATMTVGQMLAKEGFAERYAQENPIFLHEFLYPLMQGYDSVIIDSRCGIRGNRPKVLILLSDEIYNVILARNLSLGLLLPILLGTDGAQKMSKSLQNYVGVAEDALSMYSKLEKTPDALLSDYAELLTSLPLDQLPNNPRDCQKYLALDITQQFHGQKSSTRCSKIG